MKIVDPYYKSFYDYGYISNHKLAEEMKSFAREIMEMIKEDKKKWRL